jgi:hypothetical protein
MLNVLDWKFSRFPQNNHIQAHTHTFFFITCSMYYTEIFQDSLSSGTMSYQLSNTFFFHMLNVLDWNCSRSPHLGWHAIFTLTDKFCVLHSDFAHSCRLAFWLYDSDETILCTYVCICIRIRICICIYVYVYICICTFLWFSCTAPSSTAIFHMYLCMYVCMYVCIYIYIYIHLRF